MSPDERRTLAIVALACAVLLPHVPYGSVLEYPLRLIVTSAHEMGHALAAIVTGGQVREIAIYPDGSGVTWSAGGNRLITASAGYVGSTLFGCVLLILAQRARWHAIVVGGLMLYFGVFTFLFARNPLAIALGLGVLIGLWALSRSRLSGAALYFLLDFIALSSCLYSLNDFLDLIKFSTGYALATGKTDAEALAELTRLPAVAWALGWGAVSVLAAGLSARTAWAVADDDPSDDAVRDEDPIAG